MLLYESPGPNVLKIGAALSCPAITATIMKLQKSNFFISISSSSLYVDYFDFGLKNTTSTKPENKDIPYYLFVDSSITVYPTN